MSNNHRYPETRHLEICISGANVQTEPCALLDHFEQFGSIDHYSFPTSDGKGILFITYVSRSSVDRCMANRPHRLDGRHLYVKRALGHDPDFPRDHIDSTRDIMIVLDSLNADEQFLKDLREYFSSYGTLYACKYCRETNFDYVLVEFADYDQVDRIILDKPHYFNDQELNLMKCISTNKILMNIKYSSTEEESIDVDIADKFLRYEFNVRNNSFQKKNDSINENDLESEIQRLQNLIKQTSEDFNVKRKQLEEDCCEELRKLNENANKSHQLQQDLEQEYTKLLAEYESLKKEHEALNEQYIQAELENFEISAYYEQILAEEKAKTAQMEAEYTEKLEILYANHSIQSPSLDHTNTSESSTSLSPPAIPDDDDED